MVRTLTRRILARALVFAPLILAGCLSDRPDPKRSDPLTGLPKRVPPGDRAVSTTFNPGDNTKAATIATSGPRPADGTSGLSIRDKTADVDRSTPTAGAWTGNESRTGAPNGAKLASATSGGTPGAVGTRVRNFEEAQQVLRTYGVKWQDLQNVGDTGWKFTCSIPSKTNPNAVRNYEAQDYFGLTAMQKVIDQIQREQQGR